MQVNILCAMRDRHEAQRLCMEMDGDARCAFRIVTDGKDALKTARRFAPDILVIDAVLPGLDGLGVIDGMRDMFGERMPRVIGGSMLHFADAGFRHRGINSLVSVPWKREELRSALLKQVECFQNGVDFDRCEDACRRAMTLLERMGMRNALKGYLYLSWAAALAYENEARMEAVCERIYRPIAEEFDTKPQNVERLIRHAVERTMDGEGAAGVYRFFGNTIDPTRGKPTNAQCISVLAEKLRIS